MMGGSLLDAAPPRRTAGSVLASAGALVVHGGLITMAALIGTRAAGRVVQTAAVTQLIDVELPRPTPAPLPEPVADPLPPRPARLVRAAGPRAQAPPPAAAQAGQVLALADEVVEFRDIVVAGKGVVYAGGVTEAAGTATQAVHDPHARARGVEGGTGTTPSGDLSCSPRLAVGAEWDCPFPYEADELNLDEALVSLRIEVGADGRVKAVRATSDPGNGFEREARRCALDKPWLPALDRAGHPISGIATVNVRFFRR